MTKKSSYYTGYDDLDNILGRLYNAQVRAEKDQQPTDAIIREQDRLLEKGKTRDLFKEVRG